MCSEKATYQHKRLRQSYGFDEVAIVPGDVTINPDQTSTEFSIGDFTFAFPIVTSAMDSVVDVNLAIAYGKLGGIELGYSSDLDLVFVHAGNRGQTLEGKHPLDNAQFFARLGQRVIRILTAHTSAGTLYEADMRLRPSGSSGMLVSHIEAFEDYQMNAAWTWEHQALLKARAIGGDIRISKHFEKIRQNVLGRPRKQKELREEVYSMRQRMRRELLKPEPGIFDLKQDRGGMVDIEFLVQYLVLLNSHDQKQLLKWTDNVRLIQALAQTGIRCECV